MHAAFAWWEAWPLVFAPVLVGAFLRWSEVRRRRRVARLCTSNRIAALCEDLSPRRRLARGGMRVLAVLLGVVAVLQPLHGEGRSTLDGRGVDVVIALDVSRSMLARDLLPSRLLRARSEIRALLERVEGDRLGLVVFAGEARLVVPLTRDVAAFSHLADSIDTLLLARGGSDLGAALDRALAALEADAGSAAVVLLLSDGEDLEGRGLAAAERARGRKVVVHCVGLGTPQGSKIAVPSGAGERFLRDAGGAEVISELDGGTLRRIAETTGGEYADAGRTPSVLVELYERRILPLARASASDDDRRERANRFQWPLSAAVCLLLLELAWSERRRR